MTYLVNRGNQQFGPYTIEELRQYLAAGRILPTDLAWAEGMANWQPVTQVLGVSAAPPVVAPNMRPPGMRAPVKPDNYLVGAILVTLFCCLPFGVVSIVYAAQVDSKYNAGDYTGANEAAGSAKTWCFAALISWAVIAIGYVFLILIGTVASNHH